MKIYGDPINLSQGQRPRLVVITIGSEKKADLPVLEARKTSITLVNGRIPGKKLINQLQNCTVFDLVQNLIEVGYQLVNAVSFSRGIANLVRYEFAAPGHIISGLQNSEARLEELMVLCAGNSFNLLAIYQNPFFLEQELQPGESTIAVDLNSPKLLRKDEEPEFFFKKVGDNLVLTR